MRVNNSEQKNVRGLSALIYVDTDVVDDSYTYYYSNTIKSSEGTGVRVLTHAPGKNPDMKLGIDSSTGLATTIVLEQTIQSPSPQ